MAILKWYSLAHQALNCHSLVEVVIGVCVTAVGYVCFIPFFPFHEHHTSALGCTKQDFHRYCVQH
jgi:hypothetical protein